LVFKVAEVAQTSERYQKTKDCKKQGDNGDGKQVESVMTQPNAVKDNSLAFLEFLR
jgi:hypothetical protein